MSSQPGKIIQEINVDMPRPRKMEDIRENPVMAGQFVEDMETFARRSATVKTRR